MTTYNWSALVNNQTITDFNPSTDQIYIDDPLADMGAFRLMFSTTNYAGGFSILGLKMVNFIPADVRTITSANFVFQNGSQFVVGDGLIGTAFDDFSNTMVGGEFSDVLYGLGGGDSMLGQSGNDVFYGDDIFGPVGNDTMVGGLGDDIYYINAVGDVVVELESEGQDTVKVFFNDYALPSHVDNLEASIIAASGNASGNNLANYMAPFGPGGVTTLNGLGGNDTLQSWLGVNDILAGGAGDDVYIVNDFLDVVIENADEGFDVVRSSVAGYIKPDGVELLIFEDSPLSPASVAVRTGDALDNVISGGASGDYMYGQGGADIMAGGPGNDFYIVDNSNDQVMELSNSGTDEVRSGVSYDLMQAWHVERLGLTGTASINGAGNWLNNYIAGNSGSNLLTGNRGDDTLYGTGTQPGTGGADTLVGGTGNDRYDIDSADDVIVELSNEGTDLVYVRGPSFAFALPDNFENLIFEGTSGYTGIGNSMSNIITGGGGNDTLTGGLGGDTISGGIGIDVLDYSTSTSRVIVNQLGGGSTNNIVLGQDTVAPGTSLDGLGGVDITGTGFETFIGSDYDDYIFAGSSLANLLIGGTGNDSLFGGGTGDPGHADTLIGGDGDDRLLQTLGADVIQGGAGFNTLTFNSTITGGVTVNLAAGTSAIPGYTATISEINEVFGNIGNDLFIGGNSLHSTDAMGNRRTESFRGNNGNDTIDGGDGNGYYTRATYSNNTVSQPISVDLGAGTASDGRGFTDILIDVDVVYGGSGDDLLVGGSLSRGSTGSFFESFRGDEGDDTINGGSDLIPQAQSSDRAQYNNSPIAVYVDLEAGTAQDGFSGVDTLININMVYGSDWNDTLVGGDNGFQSLHGLGGDDSLVGGNGGSDQVRYDDDPAAVYVNLGSGYALDGYGGLDTIIDVERARGSDWADTLIGSNGNHDEYFDGLFGNDTIDGGGSVGDSVDFASYRSAIIGIFASTDGVTGVASDGLGSADTLLNINGLDGSNFNDTLAGGAGEQVFSGRGGSDSINGGADFDYIRYYNDPLGVIVNLGTADVFVGLETVAGGTARDGWGGVMNMQGVDTLLSIEGVDGSSQDDTLVGSAVGNDIRGLGGEDYIDGGAGADTLIGGDGNDLLIWDAGDANINGGADTDTLSLNSGGVNLNLASYSGSVIQDVEIIDITGTGSNTLTLTLADVLAISTTTDVLRIDGDAGDEVNAGSGWSTGSDQVIDPNTYRTYTQGLATLLIDTDITASVIA